MKVKKLSARQPLADFPFTETARLPEYQITHRGDSEAQLIESTGNHITEPIALQHRLPQMSQVKASKFRRESLLELSGSYSTNSPHE